VGGIRRDDGGWGNFRFRRRSAQLGLRQCAHEEHRQFVNPLQRNLLQWIVGLGTYVERQIHLLVRGECLQVEQRWHREPKSRLRISQWEDEAGPGAAIGCWTAIISL